MGAYSDRIAKEHERAGKTDAGIRADKCQRSKERNKTRKLARVLDATSRRLERDKLSWQEKWALLDARLGVNIGAARERERLAWESLNA